MKLCIINTGGTIGCVGAPLAPMPAAAFATAARRLLGPAIAAACPEIDLHFDTALRFSDGPSGTLDSTDLEPADWCRMARAILDRYDDFDGFVLLHGTDTMDFTASALGFLLNAVSANGIGMAVLSKPVILTGAQLPLFRDADGALTLNAGSDGFANLCGAMDLARLRLPEVAVFFDGKLLRGSRALKVSTTRFAGFDSPHLPPLAERGIGVWRGPTPALPGPAAPHLALDNAGARSLLAAQLAAIARDIGAHPVIQLPAYPAARGPDGILPHLIRNAVEAGAGAIVLESYGEGNFPSGAPGNPDAGAVRAALHEAGKAGVLIVDSTRVIGGQVGGFHYAAGAWMAGIGAVSAGDMTAVCAFAKTTILSAAAAHRGWDRATVATLIETDLVGECQSQDRLDARRNPVLMPGQSLRAQGATLLNDAQAGPVLRDPDGRLILHPSSGPGRLLLRGDGHLALIGRDGGTLWQSRTACQAPDTALLILEGGGIPRLVFHDAAGRFPPVALDA